jgi:hypothetical protein
MNLNEKLAQLQWSGNTVRKKYKLHYLKIRALGATV